jgi:CheY-like chemotaxis protein
MSTLSILIVEDEGIVAYDLASKIRQLGYAVAGTTSTGEEAIELARLHRPALVLMDIQLAGAMDGIAAAQQIHRECKLPILFLTANSAPVTDSRMRLAGSVGRILKPFDKRDIRIQIEKALGKAIAEESI